MFETILIDFNREAYAPEEIDSRELELAPFLYLIGERVVEAGLPRDGDLPSFVTRANQVAEGRPHIVDSARDGEGAFFSPVRPHKAMVLRSTGITTENSVLILAAAGLQITVPSLTFNIARSEEVCSLRQKLNEERRAYLEAISGMADETLERLTSGIYKDTVDWALNEAFLKIAPRAQAFDRAIRKLERPFLRRLSLGFLREGLPRISGTFLTGGFVPTVKASIEEVLKALASNLAQSIEERKVPEVVYGYKVNKSLVKWKSRPK